jgi:hypothetical protein
VLLHGCANVVGLEDCRQDCERAAREGIHGCFLRSTTKFEE